MKQFFFLKIATLYISCMCCLIQTTKAQVAKDIAITPQAAALINDIKFPVGYNTGSVDIGIPLFDIYIGNTKFPISINYNTKGIHVNELNRLTGLGWSINVEPTIARKSNGNPDAVLGYRHPNDSYWKNKNTLRTGYDISNQSESDQAPDEYFYKLMSSNGSFITKYEGNNNYAIKSISKSPLKISTTSSSMSNDYKAFSLVDDNGLVYTFPFEASNSSTGAIVPTLWHATKITSQTGDSISFTYTGRINDINISYRDRIVLEDTDNLYGAFKNDCHVPFDIESKNYLPRITRNFQRVNNLLEANIYHTSSDPIESELHHHVDQRSLSFESSLPKLYSGNSSTYDYRVLTNVIHSGGVVKFNRGANNRIESIEVRGVGGSTGGEIIKTIEFQYSDIFTGNPQGGLTFTPYYLLSQVRIRDTAQNLIERYILTYNNSQNINLSKINTNCFGYVQNSGAPSILLPIFSGYHSNTIPFKYPRFAAIGNYVSRIDSIQMNMSQFGTTSIETPPGIYIMLNSIENSLGKVTTIEYETDIFQGITYDDIWSNNPIKTGSFPHTGGAWRVKSITEGSFNAERKLINSYRMSLRYKPGRVKIQPTLNNYMSIQYRHTDINTTSPIRYRTIHSMPISKSSYGSVPVMYDTVHEVRQKYDNLAKSWIDIELNTYTYDYSERETNSSYSVFRNTTVDMEQNDEWCNGLLSSKSQYKIENNTQKLLNKTEYKYMISNTDKVILLQPYQYYIRDKEAHESNYYLDEYYGIRMVGYEQYCSGRMNKISETTKIYSESSNTYSEIKKTYTYNNDGYPSQITTYCDGDSIIENMKYARDKSISILTARHILTPLIEANTIYSDNTQQTTTNEYITSNSLAVLGRIWTKYHATNDLKIEYSDYDSYGNPCYVQEGSVKTVLIWGFNGRCLLAEIRNTTYEQANSVINSLFGKNIRQLSNGYSPDYNKISQLRIHPTLIDTQITTYQHIPFVGITKKTDPSGRNTYYTYDTAWRLHLVQDDNFNKVEQYKYNIRTN